MGIKLIVGLGNPGPKYQMTRHNVGFLFIDALVEAISGARRYKSEFKAETQKIQFQEETILVCKPQTFMNLSGESVQPMLSFYGLTPADLLVVHDEVDVGFGALRFQTKRGHGGHNGIRNIHQMLGTNEYARLRFGVGRPPVYVDDQGNSKGVTQEVHEWVLDNFSKQEQTELPDALTLAIQGAVVWVKQGLERAATQFNGTGEREK